MAIWGNTVPRIKGELGRGCGVLMLNGCLGMSICGSSDCWWFKLTLLEKAIKEMVRDKAKAIIQRALSSKEENLKNRDVVLVMVAYMEPITDFISKITELTKYAKAVGVSVTGGIVISVVTYILHMSGLI